MYTISNCNGLTMTPYTSPTQKSENAGKFAFFATSTEGQYLIYNVDSKVWVSYDQAYSYSNGPSKAKLISDKASAQPWKANKTTAQNGSAAYEFQPITSTGKADKYMNWHGGVDFNPLDNKTITVGLWQDNGKQDNGSAWVLHPVTFTVPEDSKLVFFYFGGEQGATLNEAAYTGAKDGSVKLGYKLLPAFIADRIQDLTANGNVVQRGVYRQDAIKLWKTSPVIGRGLGGFENGVVSVQDYYYETKYAHNHYVESLCDLGILGLAAFLAMLGTSIWALVKSRKEKPLIVMLLGACVKN